MPIAITSSMPPTTVSRSDFDNTINLNYNTTMMNEQTRTLKDGEEVWVVRLAASRPVGRYYFLRRSRVQRNRAGRQFLRALPWTDLGHRGCGVRVYDLPPTEPVRFEHTPSGVWGVADVVCSN
jgi:hypothetical protein